MSQQNLIKGGDEILQWDVRWQDDREQWAPLNIIKEYSPIHVVKFAISRNLEEEAAFVW